MAEKGIEVVLNTDVVDVTSEEGVAYLLTADGQKIAYDEAIWCTQVRRNTAE
jgi:NADH dehydrogenase FAD-containing subunit